MDFLLRPRSVAVVGASADPGKLSGRPLDYLKRFGYPGRIIPVNPNRDQVQGLPAVRTVSEISEAVDLALITVPAAQVAECVRDCAAAGVGVAAIFAAGFDETESGGVVQDELVRIAASSGMRLLGPNCLGALSLPNGLTATFTSALDELDELRVGNVAVVTQSGAFGTFVFSAGQREGLGFSHVVNTGNEADITAGEVVEALADDPATDVLLVYLEQIRNGQALVRGLQAARRADKPVVVVKIGTSEAGRRAARWHTGARTGDDAVIDDVLRQFGAIRVDSMEDLLDAARIFGNKRRTRGNRATVLSISGGSAALMADRAVAEGLRVDPWDDEWQERAAAGLPSYASTRNPIDLTAAVIADPDLFVRGVDTAVAHPDTDVVAVGLGNADSGAAKIVEALIAASKRTDKPIAVSWTGGNGWARRALSEAGIPVYQDPARAVKALSMLVSYGRFEDSAAGSDAMTGIGLPCTHRLELSPAGLSCRVHRDPAFETVLTLECESGESDDPPSRSAIPPFGPNYAHDLLRSLGVDDEQTAERVSRLSMTASLLDRL